MPASHPVELTLIPESLSPFILEVPCMVGAGSAPACTGHLVVSFSLWVSKAPSGVAYLLRVLFPWIFPTVWTWQPRGSLPVTVKRPLGLSSWLAGGWGVSCVSGSLPCSWGSAPLMLVAEVTIPPGCEARTARAHLGSWVFSSGSPLKGLPQRFSSHRVRGEMVPWRFSPGLGLRV